MKKGFQELPRSVIPHMAQVQNMFDFPPAPEARPDWAGSIRRRPPKGAARREALLRQGAMRRLPSRPVLPRRQDARPARWSASSTSRATGRSRRFTLRGIKDSPPYLHDGRCLTLEDTVEFFNLVQELKLTEAEEEGSGSLPSLPVSSPNSTRQDGAKDACDYVWPGPRHAEVRATAASMACSACAALVARMAGPRSTRSGIQIASSTSVANSIPSGEAVMVAMLTKTARPKPDNHSSRCFACPRGALLRGAASARFTPGCQESRRETIGNSGCAHPCFRSRSRPGQYFTAGS